MYFMREKRHECKKPSKKRTRGRKNIRRRYREKRSEQEIPGEKMFKGKIL